VAIHEAMEQQTISITKAGVKATLNARCSILAAANPNNGKYDTSQPLRYNLNLSAPIISRFDLFFILIDSNDNPVIDFEISKRIINNHRNVDNQSQATAYSHDDIRKYIMFARCFRPQISDDAEKALKHAYLKLRMNDDNLTSRITVRQLESLIRLSEAYARLKCSTFVGPEHIKEAQNLLSESIVRIISSEIELDPEDEFNAPLEEGALVDVTNRNALDNLNTDESKFVDELLDPKSEMLKITHDRYKTIAEAMVIFIREEEEKHDSEENWQGVQKSKLVEWYMETVESEISNEEEYNVQSQTMERVVTHLIRDKILIRSTTEDNPYLLVHPDYVPDKFNA